MLSVTAGGDSGSVLMLDPRELTAYVEDVMESLDKSCGAPQVSEVSSAHKRSAAEALLTSIEVGPLDADLITSGFHGDAAAEVYTTVDVAQLLQGGGRDHFTLDLTPHLTPDPTPDLTPGGSRSHSTQESPTPTPTRFLFPGEDSTSHEGLHDYAKVSVKRARRATSDLRPHATSDLRPRATSESSDSASSESRYGERRRRNNLASRRSRETRKQKVRSMEQEVLRLEDANSRLETDAARLQAAVTHLKAQLVARLS